MDDENDSAVLEAHVGTRSPCWRLGSDSNALELAAVRGLTNVAVALTVEQAACIRALTGVTSHLVLDIALFGEPVKLHLVGRKVDTTNWPARRPPIRMPSPSRAISRTKPRSPSRSCPK